MHHVVVSFAFAFSITSILGLICIGVVGGAVTYIGAWVRVMFSVTGAQGMATCGTIFVLAILAAGAYSLSGVVSMAAVFLGALVAICVGPRVSQ